MTPSTISATLLTRLRAELQPPALEALQACERVCAEMGVTLFLVGGAVRDLVLARPGWDLDLAIEGEVAPVAEAVAVATGGKAVLHDRFGTGRVSGPSFRLDLARTRRETYHEPGALPEVEPAGLMDDLARRDFSINAVALRLVPAEGELVDPYRGVDDARSKLVRVLNYKSFQDDATRMLRAVRYCGRLGFKLTTQTESLLRRDLTYLGTISGARLRRELSLMFEERAALDATLQARRLGILNAIHPSLNLPDDVALRWRLPRAELAPKDELGFCIVANPRDEGIVASLKQWLHLEGRIEDALRDLVALKSQSGALAEARSKPSTAFELLDGRAPAAVQAMTVLDTGEAAETCRSYLRDWQHVRPELTGDDLIAMGMPPGPAMGEVLHRLRAERLDGRIGSREQEIDLVRKSLS